MNLKILCHRLRVCAITIAMGGCTAFAQSIKPQQHYWELQPEFGDIWVAPEVNLTPSIDVNDLRSQQDQDRLRVAQLICLHHHKLGPKFRTRATELLLERVSREDEPVLLRRSMISAACLLNQGSDADVLWKVSQSDPIAQAEVEKALVKWKSPAALGTWRQRVTSRHASPSEVATALEGIAVCGTEADRSLLEGVLRANHTTVANRVLAAKALGELSTDGLNALAQQVLDSDAEQRHLMAAHILRKHTTDSTLNQLLSIMANAGGVAQLVAAQNIVDHFPERARDLAPDLAKHPDNPVRMLGLKVLHQQSNEASLRLQSQLLADPNPSVRALAGHQLVEKAMRGQRALVDECVTDNLQSKEWTGVEQAILAAVQLSDRSRCNRFVELLEHPRPEVNMHAGWGLMVLASETDTLSGILEHCDRYTRKLERAESKIVAPDLIRLSFLFEAIGRNKYEPAEDVLMKYVPKNGYRMGNVSRASAIWALGQLNKHKDKPDFRELMRGRVEDLAPFSPEDYLVRFMSILVLGEMGYSDSRETIVKFGDKPPAPLGYATEWALAQIDQQKK
jgi:HEAT repeat protein